MKEWFQSDEVKRNIEKVIQLGAIAQEIGANTAQLALAWCLKNPNVSTAITGASKPEQVKENMKSIDLLARLDETTMARIEEILQNKPEPDEDF